MGHHLSKAALLGASLALCAATAQAGVTILGQPGNYSTIQAAVDAAVDGDIVLVEDGTYPPFTIEDKGLAIFALSNGKVTVGGMSYWTAPSKVRDLAAHRTVVLVGLNFRGPVGWSNSPGGPGLLLSGNNGHVRIQGCLLEGGRPEYMSYAIKGGDGLMALSSARVLVTQSHLDGNSPGFMSGASPKAGGDGINSLDSSIAVYESLVHGGFGSDETYPSGGDGGAACKIDDWGLFASGSEFRGGRGGSGDTVGCTLGGNGGHGLHLVDAQVYLLDNTILAGSGNGGSCGWSSPGQPIVSIGSAVHSLPGTGRSLSGPTQIPDKSLLQLAVVGAPGDAVWLIRARRAEFRFALAFNGMLCVPYPWKLPVTPLGTIGAGGSLSLSIPIGDLVGPQAGWLWYLQALCVEPAGASFVTNPLHLLVYNT